MNQLCTINTALAAAESWRALDDGSCRESVVGRSFPLGSTELNTVLPSFCGARSNAIDKNESFSWRKPAEIHHDAMLPYEMSQDHEQVK